MKPKSIAGNPAYVLLGELGRAQGLKGHIRLKSFTAEPSAIAQYSPLVTEDGASLVITSLRAVSGPQADLFVVSLDGIDTREKAEALNRTYLYINRDRLPAPKDEDEFLYTDLIGLRAVDREGTELGLIKAISNYGGGDFLEIEPGGLLVPFTRQFVPQVNIAERFVTIDYAESADDGDQGPERQDD